MINMKSICCTLGLLIFTARNLYAAPLTIDVLDHFILGNSSKVAMGELPRWQE